MNISEVLNASALDRAKSDDQALLSIGMSLKPFLFADIRTVLISLVETKSGDCRLFDAAFQLAEIDARRARGADEKVVDRLEDRLIKLHTLHCQTKRPKRHMGI